MDRANDSLIAVANDKSLNVYDPGDYPDKVQIFTEDALREDHRALNVVGNFRPRPYQIDPLNFMLQVDPRTGRFREGLRSALCLHRRAGKTMMMMTILKLRMLQQVGEYYLIYPSLNQGRKVIWDAIAYGEDRSAFRVLEIIPPELWKRKNNHLMSLELRNGSMLQILGAVGTDGTPDHLRGIGGLWAGLDEYAVMNPAVFDVVLDAVFAENGGSCQFTFTPDGRNHAYRLIQDYLSKYENDRTGRFFAKILTIDDTKRHDGSPVIAVERIQEMRDRGVSEEYIQREFYCSFDVSNDASFYADVLNKAYQEGRVGVVKHDASIPSFGIWDLGIGVNDWATCWVVQMPNPNTINFINYLEFQGKSLSEAFGIVNMLPYPIRSHLLPWDAKRRDDVTGLTKIQRLEAANLTKGDLLRVERVGVSHGIDLVRTNFHKFYFDQANCALGLERIKKYQKQFNRTTGDYTANPVHDEASHGCDALRTFVNGAEQGLLSEYTDIIGSDEVGLYDYVECEDY